jgi:competence protein ComEC
MFKREILSLILYAHPRADAVGCAGKYSRPKCPLVFSTELARSKDIETSSIRYGMINLRCDGTYMIMAQMLEVTAGKNDVWNLYEWQLHS